MGSEQMKCDYTVKFHARHMSELCNSKFDVNLTVSLNKTAG